ncbi:hypothetical protein B1R32_11342 [Abditibacterium utsteinense]|uniref:Uncharacterized protein n=2 Tax=Abditibacterium utsteinense TaxID=1960156 RepID=A0A2S8SRA2_9BACT|nr:hypothetical protein B1R32_11342 [Abditibacterium utsteinense]
MSVLTLMIVGYNCQCQPATKAKPLDFGTTRYTWTITSSKPLELEFETSQNSWLQEKWSGDERPYRKIRDDIDKAFVQNKVTQAMLSRYTLRAKKTPSEPLERFGQIYSLYRGAADHYPGAEKEIYQLEGAFRNIPLAHKYEFTRVHFLVSAFCLSHTRLEPLGTQFIKRDPKDYSVKREMIDILDTIDPKQRKRALVYAQDLRKLRPQSALPYASLASVHFGNWSITRSTAEKQLAIKNYQQFLKLASPQDTFRPQAKRLIKVLLTSK